MFTFGRGFVIFVGFSLVAILALILPMLFTRPVEPDIGGDEWKERAAELHTQIMELSQRLESSEEKARRAVVELRAARSGFALLSFRDRFPRADEVSSQDAHSRLKKIQGLVRERWKEMFGEAAAARLDFPLHRGDATNLVAFPDGTVIVFDAFLKAFGTKKQEGTITYALLLELLSLKETARDTELPLWAKSPDEHASMGVPLATSYSADVGRRVLETLLDPEKGKYTAQDSREHAAELAETVFAKRHAVLGVGKADD